MKTICIFYFFIIILTSCSSNQNVKIKPIEHKNIQVVCNANLFSREKPEWVNWENGRIGNLYVGKSYLPYSSLMSNAKKKNLYAAAIENLLQGIKIKVNIKSKNILKSIKTNKDSSYEERFSNIVEIDAGNLLKNIKKQEWLDYKSCLLWIQVSINVDEIKKQEKIISNNTIKYYKLLDLINSSTNKLFSFNKRLKILKEAKIVNKNIKFELLHTVSIVPKKYTYIYFIEKIFSLEKNLRREKYLHDSKKKIDILFQNLEQAKNKQLIKKVRMSHIKRVEQLIDNVDYSLIHISKNKLKQQVNDLKNNILDDWKIVYVNYSLKDLENKFGAPITKLMNIWGCNQYDAFKYPKKWVLIKKNKVRCIIKEEGFTTHIVDGCSNFAQFAKSCKWHISHKKQYMYLY